MDKAERIYEFVSVKISLLQRESSWSKGMLAKLRRGVGKDPAETPDLWEITLDELPDELLYRGGVENTSATEAEWAVHTALTLYAMHQQGNSDSVNAKKSDGGLTFGSAIRRLVSSDGTNEESIKRRFDAIITSNDLCELSYHAKGLVQLMKSSTAPLKLDYPLFAKDLFYYQHSNGKNRVRLRWGQDFYNVNEKKKKEKIKNGE